MSAIVAVLRSKVVARAVATKASSAAAKRETDRFILD